MEKNTPGVVILNSEDNVAIATEQLNRGKNVICEEVSICPKSDIPPGHKVAIRPIQNDTPVVKYGQPIGLAKEDIEIGSHVHSHNLIDHHVVSDDVSDRSRHSLRDRFTVNSWDSTDPMVELALETTSQSFPP